MNSHVFDCIEIDPDGNPLAAVIWLHGLGADGHDFEPIVPELRLPESLAIRYVFPHAPMRSVTINAGMVMRAWFFIIARTLYLYTPHNFRNIFEEHNTRRWPIDGYSASLNPFSTPVQLKKPDHTRRSARASMKSQIY